MHANSFEPDVESGVHRHAALRNLTLIAVAALSCTKKRRSDWVIFGNVCMAWFRCFGVGYATVRKWIKLLIPSPFTSKLGKALDNLMSLPPQRSCYVYIPIPRGMDISDARTRTEPYPLFGKSIEAASYTLQQLMRVMIPVRCTVSVACSIPFFGSCV